LPSGFFVSLSWRKGEQKGDGAEQLAFDKSEVRQARLRDAMEMNLEMEGHGKGRKKRIILAF
jgi:hypothetical protein